MIERERQELSKSQRWWPPYLATSALVYYQPDQRKLNDIPNRLPEAAPYVVAEAQAFPPPYHDHWEQEDSPGQCQTCHQKIFDEWNGSMMSNAWRDPVWRAAFLALARATSANGECDTPEPPDGTAKATHNPFANKGECSSTFDIGTGKYKVSRPGSLLDFFCSRCHMPTDYVDNIPLKTVKLDPQTHLENAPGDPNFNPTSDNGTGIAFATLAPQYRNTDSGKSGIICAVCHTYAETRDTPFHNYVPSTSAYTPAPGAKPRSELLAPAQQDIFNVPDPSKQNLGYSIGAGSYRLSPHAIGSPERFGPLAANLPSTGKDVYTSQIFGQEIPYQKIDPAKHKGYHQAMFVRAEMCAACHDVTNALPIKNPSASGWEGSPLSARTRNGPTAPTRTVPAIGILIRVSSVTAKAAICSRITASPARHRPYIRMENRCRPRWTGWPMKGERRILSLRTILSAAMRTSLA